MVRLLVTIVTSAALGLHALLGCCWHHLHAHEFVVADAESGAERVVRLLHAHCHEHGHSHSHPKFRSDSAPAAERDDAAGAVLATGRSADHGCGEEACRFVVPAKSSLPRPSSCGLDDALAVDAALLSRQAIALCQAVTDGDPEGVWTESACALRRTQRWRL